MARVQLNDQDQFTIQIDGHSYLMSGAQVRSKIESLHRRHNLDRLEVSDSITIGLSEEGPYYEMAN
jgi:hypothetical protein